MISLTSFVQERRISGTGKSKAKFEKYQHKSEVVTYDAGMDSTLPSVPKKRKIEEVNGDDDEEETTTSPPEKKKKKKKRVSEAEEVAVKEEPEEETGKTFIKSYLSIYMSVYLYLSIHLYFIELSIFQSVNLSFLSETGKKFMKLMCLSIYLYI